MRVMMLVLILTIGGCTCVDMQGYVAADKATFLALTPEYMKYVQTDPTLDAAKKNRRRRLIETWKLRIDNSIEAGSTP